MKKHNIVSLSVLIFFAILVLGVVGQQKTCPKGKRTLTMQLFERVNCDAKGQLETCGRLCSQNYPNEYLSPRCDTTQCLCMICRT